MSLATETTGDVLREWRARKRLSQLDLAGDANISTRHLSFVESGRSVASRELLLQLSQAMAMPPRAANRLLRSAGYASHYSENAFEGPELEAAYRAVDAVLKAQEPFPALAMDRHWNIVLANCGVARLLTGLRPQDLVAPVNVLEISLDPNVLAPRIMNLEEWTAHLMARLRSQVDASGDPELVALHRRFAATQTTQPNGINLPHSIAVPLRLAIPGGAVLNLISTTTVFGTAIDVTLSELVIESFYPADDDTRRFLLSTGNQA